MYLCVSVLEADTHQIHSQIHRYKVYKTADKLVYCHEQGGAQDVERHESDEDSDGSATERDADERAAGNLSESAILRLMV